MKTLNEEEARAMLNGEEQTTMGREGRSPKEHYFSEARFAAEEKSIFRALPLLAAPAAALRKPGDFFTGNIAGLPLLFCRDEVGRARAFLNVCRHRGARLCSEAQGNCRKFVCPYHAWTYDLQGAPAGLPWEEGFPELRETPPALHEVPLQEFLGLLWVKAQPGAELDREELLNFLGPKLSRELDELNFGGHEIHAHRRMEVNANWKLIMEGGMESYHFRVAHAGTIGNSIHAKAATIEHLGRHNRFVAPRRFPEGKAEPKQLRDFAFITYSIFPNSNFFLERRHLVWVSVSPLSPDNSVLDVYTLKPSGSPDSERSRLYFDANHEYTIKILEEDMDIHESQMAGIRSDPDGLMNFGIMEGALSKFHDDLGDLV